MDIIKKPDEILLVVFTGERKIVKQLKKRTEKLVV
jgi:hypothetical protein